MGKQGILSYRAEGEQTSQNLTALSGLAPYLDLMVASGLVDSIRRNVDACGEQIPRVTAFASKSFGRDCRTDSLRLLGLLVSIE